MIKWIILGLIAVAVISLIGVMIWVEREAPDQSEILARGNKGKALILYHPSRDAHFSDDLTVAMAHGFRDAGMATERRTMTSTTPAKPQGFTVVAVVSNTFFFRPDWPTMRYLERADLQGIPVIAIMAGGGSTTQSQTKLYKALKHANADLQGVKSLWTSRPNDPTKPADNNRKVAEDIARKFAFDLAVRLQRAEKPLASEATPAYAAVSPQLKSIRGR